MSQIALAAAQEPEPVYFPDDPLWVDPDDHDIEPPAPRTSSAALQAVTDSLLSENDPSGYYARNINTVGEVPDSTWFTNRQGVRPLSPEELRSFPRRIGPPADGKWRVIDLPAEGRTPKFTIEDERGRTYFIKVDSPDHPELMSAAEVIGTHFFYSIGYNVPENYIVYFDPARLVFDGAGGDPRVHSLAILDTAPRNEEGLVRVVASLALDGEPLGPFSYSRTRLDDPNDIFPHQHRRELRGLRVFAAWLNHTDVKEGNSLDIFVEEDGRHFVRHYLIDFGSILGSAGVGAKDPVTGNELYFEPLTIIKSAATLGLWPRPYLRLDYAVNPAIGRLEADYYDPARWIPPIPNPAFALLDAADAFWAARIVSRFDTEAVRAIVSAGQISDPKAGDVLVDILETRRDKTVRYWLTATNPLEAFTVEEIGSELRLRFKNGAVELGLAAPPTGYRVRWLRFDNDTGAAEPVGEESSASEPDIAVPDDAWSAPDKWGARYARAEVVTDHQGFPHWRRPVIVTLRATEDVKVVGVRRPRELPQAP